MPSGVLFRAPGETGGAHTCRDYGLYLADRPEIEEAKVKTNYLTIPGKDGALDLSEALTGAPVYDTRELKITLVTADPFLSWETIATRLRHALLGKRKEIVFDDDDGYIYDARITGVKLTHEKYAAMIEIKATAAPYKLEHWGSSGDWMWDPFEFDNMVARDLSDIEIPAASGGNAGSVTVEILGTHMPVSPAFLLKSGSGVTVSHTGAATSMAALEIGSAKMLPSLTVRENNETVTFTNAGGTEAVVDILLRDGSL